MIYRDTAQILTHSERYGGDGTFQAHYQDEVIQFGVQEAPFRHAVRYNAVEDVGFDVLSH